MVKYNISTFGVIRDITGTDLLVLETEALCTASDLRNRIKDKFQGLKAIKSIAVAVDTRFAKDNEIIAESAEIALIPPVSGG